MGRFLLFWGMQPVGGKCGGVRGPVRRGAANAA